MASHEFSIGDGTSRTC